MKLLAIAILLATACVMDAGEEGFDLTLNGDSKADELGGRRVHFQPGASVDWASASDPELYTNVKIRSGTLMLVDAQVALFRQQPGTISIGIQPTVSTVELAFIVADASKLAGGELVPFRCGGGHMFKTFALDFARSEVTADAKKLSFADCGVASRTKDDPDAGKPLIAVLAVPWKTTDGSEFRGRYAYHHVVQIR